MGQIKKSVFWFSMIFCIFILGTSCRKEDRKSKNPVVSENRESILEAVYDDGTGLITAQGLAFEVTEDVEKYTMSVFSIVDYDKEEYTIPSKLEYDGLVYEVTAIGKSAFEGETNLKRVEITEGIEKIEESAFYNCENLKEVIMPKGVVFIGDYGFGECVNLTELVLPDTIKEIGTEAFIHCNGFSEFQIPGSVTTMGNSVFYECENLEKVVLEEGITDLFSETFTNCTALREISLPDTLLSIGTEVFWSCESLKRLEIPKNVVVIGERCFYTSGIKELVLHSVKIRPSEELFEGVDVERVLVTEKSKNLFWEFFEDTDVEVEVMTPYRQLLLYFV